MKKNPTEQNLKYNLIVKEDHPIFSHARALGIYDCQRKCREATKLIIKCSFMESHCSHRRSLLSLKFCLYFFPLFSKSIPSKKKSLSYIVIYFHTTQIETSISHTVKAEILNDY